jgi:inosine/xanthosine triphosphatase
MPRAPLFSVGSQNPVKVASVAEAVRDFWQGARVEGVKVSSAVSDQPRGDGEIRRGALHRARQALSAVAEAQYGVGLEGGVVDGEDGMWVYAWVAVADRSGRIGEGRTGQFLLPEPVARLIRDEGLEMGDADDRYFGRTNSKQEEGAIGLLTGRKLTRQDFYRQAVVFALLPFIRPEHYAQKRDSHPCPL